ncbi:MAG: gliding motility-associated C-terminal domain-containing protein [bacterium]
MPDFLKNNSDLFGKKVGDEPNIILFSNSPYNKIGFWKDGEGAKNVSVEATFESCGYADIKNLKINVSGGNKNQDNFFYWNIPIEVTEGNDTSEKTFIVYFNKKEKNVPQWSENEPRNTKLIISLNEILKNTTGYENYESYHNIKDWNILSQDTDIKYADVDYIKVEKLEAEKNIKNNKRIMEVDLEYKNTCQIEMKEELGQVKFVEVEKVRTGFPWYSNLEVDQLKENQQFVGFEFGDKDGNLIIENLPSGMISVVKENNKEIEIKEQNGGRIVAKLKILTPNETGSGFYQLQVINCFLIENWTTDDDLLLKETNGKLVKKKEVFNNNKNFENGEVEFKIESEPIYLNKGYPCPNRFFISEKALFWWLFSVRGYNVNWYSVDNPYTCLEKWEIEYKYLSVLGGKWEEVKNEDFEIIKEYHNVNNTMEDYFKLKLKPETKSKVFIEIKGTIISAIAQDSAFCYSLFYKKEKEENIHPIIFSYQSVKNETIAYWDVTGLNGNYEVILIKRDSTGVDKICNRIKIGREIDTDTLDWNKLIVTSPYNRTNLKFSVGLLKEKKIVTITPINLKEVGLFSETEVCGPIYEFQPKETKFEGQRPELSVRFFEEELSCILKVSKEQIENYVGKINIWHIGEEGNLEALHTTSFKTFLGSKKLYTFRSSVSSFSPFFILKPLAIPLISIYPRLTNQCIIKISGETEANTYVEILVNGVSYGFVWAEKGENEKWKFEKVIEIVEGINVIKARTRKVVDKKNFYWSDFSVPVEVILDRTIPQITNHKANPNIITPNNDGKDDVTKIQYIISEDCNVEVNIVDKDNVYIAECLDSGEKKAGVNTTEWDGYAYDDCTGRRIEIVDPGIYRYVIEVIDMAGNFNQVSGEIKVTDYDAPITTFSFLNSVLNIDGKIFINNKNGFRLLAIDGYPGVKETKYQIGNQSELNYTGAGNGTYFNLADGEYKIGYYSIDKSENIEPKKYQRFNIDTTAPELWLETTNGVVVVADAEDNFVCRSETKFVVKAKDDGSGVSSIETWDGSKWNKYNNEQLQFTGNVSFNYKAIDKLGNIAQKRTTIIIDDAKPIIQIYYLEEGGKYAVGKYFQVNISDAHLLNKQAKLNDKEIALEKTITITESGQYTLYCYGKDTAGNISEKIVHFAVSIADAISPEIWLEADGVVVLEDNFVCRSETKFVVKAKDDGSGLASIQTYDGTNWKAYNNEQLQFTGNVSFNYKAIDKAGNIAQKKTTIITDDIAPAIKIGGIENNGAYEIERNFWCNIGDENGIKEYSVKLDGVSQPIDTSITVKDPGEHKIEIVVIDKAGNIAEKKISFWIIAQNTLEIITPETGSIVNGIIKIRGTSTTPYTLEYGQGENPNDWKLITRNEQKVLRNLLGKIDTNGLSGIYTIKLSNREKSEYRQIVIGNLEIEQEKQGDYTEVIDISSDNGNVYLLDTQGIKKHNGKLEIDKEIKKENIRKIKIDKEEIFLIKDLAIEVLDKEGNYLRKYNCIGAKEIGILDNKLIVLKENEIVIVNEIGEQKVIQGIKGKDIYCYKEKLYVGTEKGILIYDKEFNLLKEINIENIEKIRVDEQGRIYVVKTNEVYCYNEFGDMEMTIESGEEIKGMDLQKEKMYIVDKNKIKVYKIEGAKVIKLSPKTKTENRIEKVVKPILNYPNPFNPECYIPLENSEFKIQNLKLRIYNILGQVIREIIANNANNSVYWDGRDNLGKELSSGMYFYEIIVDNKAQSCKKMLMLK